MNNSDVDHLVQLSVQRLATADIVAAAKFGTLQPIDDPAREAQVENAAEARAQSLGLDRGSVIEFFRDQIEANKIVQRGLHQRWQAEPSARPSSRPDLARTVRPQLDQLTATLLDSLQRVARIQPKEACPAGLTAAQENSARFLDDLHRSALTRALQHVCRR